MRPIIRGQPLVSPQPDPELLSPEPAQDVLAPTPDVANCYTENTLEYSLNKVKQASHMTTSLSTFNDHYNLETSIEASIFGKEEIELDPKLEPFKERVLAHNEDELLCLRQVKHAQEHLAEVTRNERTLLRQKQYLDGELAAFEQEDETFSAEDHDHLMAG